MADAPARVPRFFEFPPTLPELLARCVADAGAADLVVTETGERWTYADIDVSSRRLARRLLAAGIGKGQRVGLLAPQGPEWLVGFFAIGRIGAVAVTLSTFAKPPELVRTLHHGDVHLLLTPATLLQRDVAGELESALPALATAPGPFFYLDELPFLRAVWFLGASERLWGTSVPLDAPEDDSAAVVPRPVLTAAEQAVHSADPLALVYTSGTTSDPKGVFQTHGALVRHGANLHRMEVAIEGDRTYAGMPFFWIGGLSYTLGPTLHARAALLTQERFEPGGAIRFMERERATNLTGWVNVKRRIISHPNFASANLRLRIDLTATHKRPRSGIGMTETCASYLYHDPGGHPISSVPGSVGLPLEGFEVRIADPETNATAPHGVEGEFCVRGYAVTVGLAKREREETFDEDGWYHTGDKGYVGPDGTFVFTGRLKEMIKTAGSNVAPPEVEAVLLAHPSVVDAHVVGVSDDERGELVAAAVVLRNTCVDPTELVEWASQRLASYKVPHRVRVLSETEVPYLGSGKPDRRRLASLLERAPIIERPRSCPTSTGAGPGDGVTRPAHRQENERKPL